MTGFDAAFDHVLELEGGFVNDPRDPGGKTNWGITAATLEQSIGLGLVPKGVTPETLTPEQAKVIYRELYWKPVRGDELPWPLSAFVFDAAVNQGVGAAVLMLQATLGVAQDGRLGPVTLAAARRGDPVEVASLYMARRALRYTGTRNFDRFGLGWMKRIHKLSMLTR